ncbi:hypothetical protein AMTR_s00011p00071590 [Amborella trichopoda]|uniref:Uncharacterized protein n=1 Tax=Amborella trichopoda TaxID=13333 RepID=W1NHB1_AMBTC|nr:hypothetical protein AMTR_s00011p00071590 [Amborella trichopoda]
MGVVSRITHWRKERKREKRLRREKRVAGRERRRWLLCSNEENGSSRVVAVGRYLVWESRERVGGGDSGRHLIPMVRRVGVGG